MHLSLRIERVLILLMKILIVEVRKQVVHQELLELMHKDDYFAYLRSLRLRRNKTKGAKSKVCPPSMLYCYLFLQLLKMVFVWLC